MSTSRKLAITQLVLLVIVIFLGLFTFGSIFLLFVKMPTSLGFLGSVWLVIIGWLLKVAIVIIGIVQIVFAAKEKQTPVFLAASICAVASIIPFVAFFIRIAAIILNIVGIVKTKNA